MYYREVLDCLSIRVKFPSYQDVCFIWLFYVIYVLYSTDRYLLFCLLKVGRDWYLDYEWGKESSASAIRENVLLARFAPSIELTQHYIFRFWHPFYSRVSWNEPFYFMHFFYKIKVRQQKDDLEFIARKQNSFLFFSLLSPLLTEHFSNVSLAARHFFTWQRYTWEVGDDWLNATYLGNNVFQLSTPVIYKMINWFCL